MSHARPAPPLELLLLELLLELLLLLVPLEPLEPLEPLVPLEPLEPLLVPVSAAFAESGAPLSGAGSLFAGSFAPGGSGVGCADFVSSVVAPRPSSGEVAHAEMRATSDRPDATMRVELRMAGTVAAELCGPLGRLGGETLR